MNIYQLLRTEPLPLSEIPPNLDQQLKTAMSEGWITSTFKNGIEYYSLRLFLMPEHLPDPRDYKFEDLVAGVAPISAPTTPPKSQDFFISCTNYSP